MTVYSAQLCEVSFDYTFTTSGANASGGEPMDGVFFEMKQLDSAGNISNTSTPLFVYYDTQAPVSPEIMINNDDIFVKGERFADNEILMYAPDGTLTSSGTVRADKYGYTQTGVHTVFKDLWGIYTIGVRSYDASGNISVSTKILERIKPTPTPEPTKESVYEEVPTSGGTTYYTTGQVKGTKTVYTTQTINQTVTKTVTKTVTEQVKKPCDWTWNIFDSNNCVNVWATDMWQTVTKKVTETIQVVQQIVKAVTWAKNEFNNGAQAGVQSTLNAIGNTIKTVVVGEVAGLQYAGNSITAIVATVQSNFNGKSAIENYNNLNIFGDAQTNKQLLDTARNVETVALAVGVVTAITKAPALVAGAVISTGAIVYNAYEIAKSNPNQSLGDSIKQATCNGNKDASIFYCAGNVVGQIATGEVIAISAAKAIGTIGKYAGNTVKSETKALSVVDDIAKTETKTAIEVIQPQSLDELKFTQKTASVKFNEEGPLANRTIGEVANELQVGTMTPKDLPIEVIVRNDQILTINTRSSLALRRAGIPVSEWKFINVTGNAQKEFDLTKRLLNNKLTDEGTDVIRITGDAPNVSNLR